MSVITGLKKIQEKQERRQRKDFFDFKNNLFKISDGETVTVRFPQELDESAEHYDPELGLGFLAVEHQPSSVFPKKILCTYDPETGEPCFGCEHARSGDSNLYNEWKAKQRLYINVLVKQGNEWHVKVLNQGYGPKSVSPQLVDWAVENGTITNLEFRIKRQGAGRMDTGYSLTPVTKTLNSDFDYSEYELFDLNELLQKVPYDEQQEHLLGGLAEEEESEEQSWV